MFSLLLLSASFWPCYSTTCQGGPDSPDLGALASSGGVQITTITTTRIRNGYAPKKAVVDNTLTPDIWILYPKKVDTSPNIAFLLRMVEIKPINDNTGT